MSATDFPGRFKEIVLPDRMKEGYSTQRQYSRDSNAGEHDVDHDQRLAKVDGAPRKIEGNHTAKYNEGQGAFRYDE